MCKKQKATLVIAKLDRLARNVHFVASLMESGVRFIAVDMPNADAFMLHIYAAVAEQEARAISSRTRAALASAKARGVVLGRYGATLAKQNSEGACAYAEEMLPVIERLNGEGISSVRAVADALNARAVPTPQGGKWHCTSVHRLLSRIRALRKEELADG